MADQDQGVAYPVAGRLEWWRGPAKIQGPYVVLDTARAERYWLDTEAGPGNDLVFEFAQVSSLAEVVEFVADWGLLAIGPHSGRHTEETAAVIGEARTVHTILSMYADLVGFAEKGEEHAPMKQWATVLTEAYGVDEEPNPLLIADVVAKVVNNELGPTPLALAVNEDFGAKGEAPFVASVGASDLRSLVYFHLATLLMDSIPVRSCEECRRIYQVNHQRQLYCSERCGTRARQRRFAERRHTNG